MNTKRLAPLALVAMFGVAAAGGTAFAGENSKEEAQDAALLASAKISLSQAITAAEQQYGGKAIGAGIDNANGHLSITVDVAKGQSVQTVLVDPQTGKVTGTQQAGDGDTEQAD